MHAGPRHHRANGGRRSGASQAHAESETARKHAQAFAEKTLAAEELAAEAGRRRAAAEAGAAEAGAALDGTRGELQALRQSLVESTKAAALAEVEAERARAEAGVAREVVAQREHKIEQLQALAGQNEGLRAKLRDEHVASVKEHLAERTAQVAPRAHPARLLLACAGGARRGAARRCGASAPPPAPRRWRR